MAIIVKEGVVFKKITYPIYKVLGVLFEIETQIGKEMVITSANDSKHRPDSLHYKDLAIDIRTRHLLDKDEKNFVLNYLRSKLGGDYDVIFEENPEHIHIEYDPKNVITFAK